MFLRGLKKEEENSGALTLVVLNFLMNTILCTDYPMTNGVHFFMDKK